MQVNSSGRRTHLWIAGAAGVFLLAILAVFGYSRLSADRESELRRMSTENLRRLDADKDADTLLHYVYAKRLFESGASDEARTPIMRATEAVGKTPQAGLGPKVFALAGCIAADIGALDAADRMLSSAAQTLHDDPLLYIGRGTLALRREHAAEAVDALTRACRLDPNSAEAWKRLGRAYLLGAEPEPAADAFRRAVHRNSADPMDHALLGQALLQLKQFPEAESEYKAVAGMLPTDPYFSTMPLRVAALAARTDADYTDAAAQLDTALLRQPNDDALRAELAGLQIRFNRFEAARDSLRTILEHNPVISADCWYNLATVCKRIGDEHGATDARSHFQQVIALKNSAADLTELTQTHPTDARLFFRLSIALLNLQQVDKAYAALARAATLDPNDPEIAGAMRGAQERLRTQQGAAPGIGAPLP